MFAQNAIARLDEGIADIEKHLVILKRKRNSMVPICRLPDELLVLLMRHIQSKPWTLKSMDLEFYDFDAFDLRWMQITWVCQHIRRVAIDSPELWTEVCSEQSPEWNDLCASRSREAGICMDIPYGHYGEREHPAAHLSNARQARIESWGLNLSRAVEQHLPTRLQVLHAQRPYGLPAISFIVSVADQLVELCLDDVYVEVWPQVTWTKLRRLRLTNPTSHPENLVLLVTRMPDLRTLIISDLRPPRDMLSYLLKPVDMSILDALAQAERAPSTLHHLIRIVISDSPAILEALMTCIFRVTHRPNHPHIELHAEWYDGFYENITPLLAHLSDKWEWKQPIPSAVVFRHEYHAPDMYDLILKSEQGDLTHHASTLQVSNLRFNDDSMLREHEAIIHSLVIERVNVDERFFRELETLISHIGLNIVNIVFRDLNNAPALRSWVDSRNGTDKPIKSVTYEDCRDAVDPPSDFERIMDWDNGIGLVGGYGYDIDDVDEE
jgi:hypothetical protein